MPVINEIVTNRLLLERRIRTQYSILIYAS